MKCAQYEVLFLPRGGVDPPGLHGRAVRAENDQPTAAKPLDPESILFYILDIWLMYEALYGSKSPIFHIPHIAHVKICYNLCYTRKFLNLTGLDVPFKLSTTTLQSRMLRSTSNYKKMKLNLTFETFPRCPYCNYRLERIPNKPTNCANCGRQLSMKDFTKETKK